MLSTRMSPKMLPPIFNQPHKPNLVEIDWELDQSDANILKIRLDDLNKLVEMGFLMYSSCKENGMRFVLVNHKKEILSYLG